MDKREKMKLKQKSLLESKKPKASVKKDTQKETPKKDSKLE